MVWWQINSKSPRQNKNELKIWQKGSEGRYCACGEYQVRGDPLIKETPDPSPLPTPEPKMLKMKKKKIRGKKSMKPENFEVPDPLARRQIFGIV